MISVLVARCTETAREATSQSFRPAMIVIAQGKYACILCSATRKLRENYVSMLIGFLTPRHPAAAVPGAPLAAAPWYTAAAAAAPWHPLAAAPRHPAAAAPLDTLAAAPCHPDFAVSGAPRWGLRVEGGQPMVPGGWDLGFKVAMYCCTVKFIY